MVRGSPFFQPAMLDDPGVYLSREDIPSQDTFKKKICCPFLLGYVIRSFPPMHVEPPKKCLKVLGASSLEIYLL